MLDLFTRECPRCRAPVHGEPLFCSGCRRMLPAKLSKTRRVIEDSLLAVLVVGLGAAIFAPDLMRSFRAEEAPAARPIAAWRGAGAEPKSRAWAAPIESSLADVCRSTFTRYEDRKFVVEALSQQLGLVTRAQGLRITQESLRLTPEEEKDAMSVVGDEQRFMGECLRWGYQAISGCEGFKADLGSYDARDCMVPKVLRVLASAPFALCGNEAKLDRVRRACTLASQAAARAAEKR